MKNVFFKLNNEKFYVIAGDTAKREKEKLKCSWKTLLGVLCKENFPNIKKVTEKTENNHIVTIPFFEELIFFVMTIMYKDKKIFVVTANEKVKKFKLKKFGKWIAELDCGHTFLMDSGVDDYRFIKRIFCPTCMENTDGSVFK